MDAHLAWLARKAQEPAFADVDAARRYFDAERARYAALLSAACAASGVTLVPSAGGLDAVETWYLEQAPSLGVRERTELERGLAAYVGDVVEATMPARGWKVMPVVGVVGAYTLMLDAYADALDLLRDWHDASVRARLLAGTPRSERHGGLYRLFAHLTHVAMPRARKAPGEATAALAALATGEAAQAVLLALKRHAKDPRVSDLASRYVRDRRTLVRFAATWIVHGDEPFRAMNAERRSDPP